MSSIRFSLNRDELKIILDALQNQVWSYETAKHRNTGVDDETIDKWISEVLDVKDKLKEKLANRRY